MANTKTCNLTEAEIEELIMHHGRNVAEDFSGRIERLSYLHKRLKSFSEPEIVSEDQPKQMGTPKQQGWGT